MQTDAVGKAKSLWVKEAVKEMTDLTVVDDVGRKKPFLKKKKIPSTFIVTPLVVMFVAGELLGVLSQSPLWTNRNSRSQFNYPWVMGLLCE